MNERIRLLVAQADKLSLQYANKNNINFVDAFNIVFAELIVRECVVCAEREWIRNGDTEHNRAVSKIIGSIKEHFGVEE